MPAALLVCMLGFPSLFDMIIILILSSLGREFESVLISLLLNGCLAKLCNSL